jgi:hypothetical protein
MKNVKKINVYDYTELKKLWINQQELASNWIIISN